MNSNEAVAPAAGVLLCVAGANPNPKLQRLPGRELKSCFETTSIEPSASTVRL